jgi:hypothetical protein
MKKFTFFYYRLCFCSEQTQMLLQQESEVPIGHQQATNQPNQKVQE